MIRLIIMKQLKILIQHGKYEACPRSKYHRGANVVVARMRECNLIDSLSANTIAPGLYCLYIC